MFNYRQSGPFQTPSASHYMSRRTGRRTLNSIQEDAQIYSAMKPSKLDVNQRSKRRFGTNLTNKRPMSRITHSYDLSKTQQIMKPSKQISFASRAPAAPQSSFKYDFRVINEQKTGFEEPEYCPSGTSWKMSIDRSLHRILQKAYRVIGSYKLFIPSKTTQMDCEIPVRFQEISAPRNEMTLPFLYDTDSEDTEEDAINLMEGNCDIPLIDEEMEEVVLEYPMFL